MPRETAMQRNARLEAERANREALSRATYMSRVMGVLERATKANFELEVKDEQFVLEDRDDRRGGTYRFPAQWSTEADNALANLEWEVEHKEEAEREAARRAQVRAQALSKLSAEERELLGL